ncbi:MAG: VOC family protein, partial [Candidatus Cybelea sp.]
LTPFVYFYGRCTEALEFYKNALDGNYEILMRDGEKIQYATFTALGISFKASDGMSAHAIDPDEGNVVLALNVLDVTRARKIFDALSDGGEVVTAFGEAQWGGKFGQLNDRFGNEWFVTAP